MKILLVAYDNTMYINEFPIGLAYITAIAQKIHHEVTIYKQDVHDVPFRPAPLIPKLIIKLYY